jgi:hypothetical protein
MPSFLDKALGMFLFFGLPLLIAAFAPYWVVGVFAVVVIGLVFLSHAVPDPEGDADGDGDRIDPCVILGLASAVILILRFVS